VSGVNSQYRSHDGRLLINTLAKEEVGLFLNTLQQYHAHIVRQEGTALPRFLALFRIGVKDSKVPTYMLVQRSVLSSIHETHAIYDLKGSTFGREASAAGGAAAEEMVPTYKDNDFREQVGAIRLPPETRAALLETVRADAELLNSLNVMDYRLLVAVHEYGDAPPEMDTR